MNLAKNDALALAAAIASGETTATAALETSIRTVERLNPRINAVCNPAFDVGRARAQSLDRELNDLSAAERVALLDQRPFLGVPSLVKDLSTAVSDIPSTMGSRLFGRVTYARDSNLIARMRKAGLIFFGRTTSPEMGISPSTEAQAYGGPTRNPWLEDHSAGGSSGGAAAAVASGMVRIAHASDGAGSIRIPASACGLIGLKPSRGLMPLGPAVGEGWGGLAVENVVCLSVRDSAAILDTCAGSDLGAPYAAPAMMPAPQGYRRAVDAAGMAAMSGRSARPARVSILTTTLEGESIHPEVAEAVAGAGRALGSLGHQLREGGPKVGSADIIRPAALIMASGTAMAIDEFVRQRGRPLADDELEPITASAVQTGRTLSASEFLQHVGALHRLTRQIAAFFDPSQDGSDYLLMPVLAEPPAVLGRFAMSRRDSFMDYRLGPDGLIRYSPFAPMANATGQPAVSVPFGWSASGLPIGVQIVGRFGDDAGVLALAAEIEAVHPWMDRYPFTRDDPRP